MNNYNLSTPCLDPTYTQADISPGNKFPGLTTAQVYQLLMLDKCPRIQKVQHLLNGNMLAEPE